MFIADDAVSGRPRHPRRLFDVAVCDLQCLGREGEHGVRVEHHERLARAVEHLIRARLREQG